MDYSSIKKTDKTVFGILQDEIKRQNETLNLIASENYVSPAVIEALGTPFTNKYAEGKSGARYYQGNANSDRLEDYAKKLLLKLFGLPEKKWSANVQPYSGSPANLAVYSALVQKGETVLAMHLDHGGHLTHGHTASITGKFFKFIHYGVRPDGLIDYDQVAKLAKEYKPKLIVCGATAYSRIIDFKKFSSIARSCGAYLMADISHIAGLVATGAHPSPFPYADIVTSTTHKTLRGPRGAFIISKKLKVKIEKLGESISDRIDGAVFPGLQGGPHLNQICAMAVAFREALRPDFKKYTKQVVTNAKTLASELIRRGLTVISGGTDNHLLLVDVTQFNLVGGQAAKLLEESGIICNKNMIPFDKRKPWNPSGIRLGTPAITTRKMKEKEMKKIAEFISRCLVSRERPDRIKKEVLALTKMFPVRM